MGGGGESGPTGAGTAPAAAGSALAWAEAELGERLEPRDASRSRAASRVWAVHPLGAAADAPARAYLKLHASPRKHAQERDALRAWGPAVPALPALLAWRDGGGRGGRGGGPRALLLEALPGAPGAADPAAYRAAGRAAARLHAQRVPGALRDAMPPELALARRADALERRLRRLDERPGERLRPRAAAAEDERARAAAAVALRFARARAPAAAGLPRVPCHRDLAPRNWLRAPDGAFGVIDLEHARPDLAVVDLLALGEGAPGFGPEHEAAFLEGWGREPDARERGALDALRALRAAGTWIWARERGDAALAAEGRAALARLPRYPDA